MALFTSTQDLFEIMPRGIGHETREGLEQKLKELLSLDGKTIVVVDEIPPEAEGGGIPDEFTIRKDTAAVIVVAVVVALGVSFLGGRASVRSVKPVPVAGTTGVNPAKPQLPAGIFDPRSRVTNQQPTQQAPAGPAPTAPAIVEHSPAPITRPGRTAVKRKYILPVVSTTRDKAKAVVDFLNSDSSSPIARRLDLCAVVVGSRETVSVRIRGFAKKEDLIKQAIAAMKDPTGGGRLGGAPFYTER